jgi:Co/Zn/Cd efflux system component
LLEHERIALAIIALITGMMAFIESMVAVPAASTALAADALSFVQHSVSAGFALKGSTGYMRPRWTVQLQGIVMMLLGGLVCVIAIRRTLLGSFPHYLTMIVMGLIALCAHFCACAIMLHSRGQLTSLGALWRFTRTDAVGNIAVIAAAGAVAMTRSNIPDLVIGAAMAGLFLMAGWRIAMTGRVDAGQTR